MLKERKNIFEYLVRKKMKTETVQRLSTSMTLSSLSSNKRNIANLIREREKKKKGKNPEENKKSEWTMQLLHSPAEIISHL